MKDYSYHQIEAECGRLGHAWFTGAYDLNLGVVRSPEANRDDKFLDLFYLAFVTETGAPRLLTWPGTSVPGDYYLQNPITKKGSGAILPGQYRGVYAPGRHPRVGGKPALRQVGPFTVFRDTNRDDVLDVLKGSIAPARCESGLFGMNFHRASPGYVSTRIGKWSAGCQVPAIPQAVDIVLRHVDVQALYGHGSKVSYTVLARF